MSSVGKEKSKGEQLAEAFERELVIYQGWNLEDKNTYKNNRGDKIIRHDSPAGDIRYELQIRDAIGFFPGGSGGSTAHSLHLLDDVRSYMEKAAEKMKASTSETEKSKADENDAGACK